MAVIVAERYANVPVTLIALPGDPPVYTDRVRTAVYDYAVPPADYFPAGYGYGHSG